MTVEQPVPRTLHRQWIVPPEQPEEATLRQRREAFGAEPRIVEAWLVGSRTQEDGSAPCESTDIALVLDPPFPDEPGEPRAQGVLAWVAELTESVSGLRPRHGRFLFVTTALIRAHEDHTVPVYSRVDEQHGGGEP